MLKASDKRVERAMPIRGVSLFVCCAAVLAFFAAACSTSTTIDSADTSEPIAPAGTAEQDDAAEQVATAESADDEPNVTAFTDVTLGSSTVEELDRVALVGLGDEFDASSMAVMAVIGDIAVPLAVLTDDDGAYFTAPLNPQAPGTAGATEVFLTNGVDDGPRLRLALTALPPAPGAAAEYAQFMWDLVDAQASDLGSSFDELQATSFADTRPALARLKLLQGLIDDGSTNDLMSALSADESGLSAGDMALVDSVIAKIDPQASIQPPPPPPAPPGGSNPPAPPSGSNPPAPPAGSNPPAPPSGSNPPAPPSGSNPPPPPPDTTAPLFASVRPSPGAGSCNSADIPEIGSAQQLANALATGVAASKRLSGATGKVLNDFKSVLAHGSAIPEFGPVIGAIGAGYNTLFLAEAADAGRYPSALTALTVDVSPTEFNEDFAEDGTWSNVRVSATSTGYNATGDVIGLAVDGVGIGVGARNLATEESVGAALDAGGKVVNTATGEFLSSDAGPEFARFCPHTWTVELPATGYTTVRSTLGMLNIDSENRTFKPTELGRDQLVIETDGDVFSDFVVSAPTEVGTKQAFVQLNPNDVEVQRAGDVVSISVGFVNSDSTSVRWTSTGGEFVDGLGDVTQGEVTRELRTPGDSSGFDVTVTATLETKQGLFATTRTAPSDATLLRLADLIVDPAGASVAAGGQVQYSAMKPDGQTIEVRWSAGGGAIGDGGLYQAGDKPGTYQVTATAISDPELSATVLVTIVDTSCLEGKWRIRLDEMAAQLSQQVPDGSFLFISGEYVITMFADATWRAERRELIFEIVAQGQTAQMHIVSAETGTYSADGSTITIVETSSDASATIVIPGIGSIGGAVPDSSSVGSGAYTCERPVMTVSADGFVSTADYLGPPGG